MHLKPLHFIAVGLTAILLVTGLFFVMKMKNKPEQPANTTAVETTVAEESTTEKTTTTEPEESSGKYEPVTLIPPVIMTTEVTTAPPTTEPTPTEPTTKKPEPTTAEPTTQPPTTKPEPSTEEISVPDRIGDKDTEELVDEVLAGKWGNGRERKNRLNAAGYDYKIVQAAVNRRLGYVEQEID